MPSKSIWFIEDLYRGAFNLSDACKTNGIHIYDPIFGNHSLRASKLSLREEKKT